jgi:voltage-dependent calcium channel L type alpha-1D
MFLIISNTVILATDKYPKPEKDLIQSTNQIFIILFTAECVIKLLGITTQDWKSDIFNIFDLVIVIGSYVEMVLSSDNTAIIGALRTLRLLRLVKLARSSSHTLKCLLDSIVITIAQCANFVVILMLFIYVFSLLGMEIFAEYFKFDDKGMYDRINGSVPRQNYDDIFSAILSTFQVLLGEKWNEVMYLGYQAQPRMAVLYFIGLVLFGKIILLNLFLAILLGQFNQASNDLREQEEQKLMLQF